MKRSVSINKILLLFVMSLGIALSLLFSIKTYAESELDINNIPEYQHTTRVVNNKNGIYVYWKESSNAEGYNVYRKEGTAGKWKKIKYISGRWKTKYLDKGVKNNNGKLYYYTVRGVIGKKYSKFDKYGKGLVRLRTSGLSVNNDETNGVVSLTWQRNGAATGYEIQYGTDGEFK